MKQEAILAAIEEEGNQIAGVLLGTPKEDRAVRAALRAHAALTSMRAEGGHKFVRDWLIDALADCDSGDPLPELHVVEMHQ